MFETLKMPAKHPTYQGRCVIAGGAMCVWDDIQGFAPEIRGGGTDLMCVNDIGMHMPLKVRHWFSNGPGDVQRWRACRRRGYNEDIVTHALEFSSQPGKVHWVWPWPGHGTSSLNAVYTALQMGYTDVVLCGVPLDNQPNYFSPAWERRNFEREVPDRDGRLKWWGRAADERFNGRVKSMSGRTRELLGAP